MEQFINNRRDLGYGSNCSSILAPVFTSWGTPSLLLSYFYYNNFSLNIITHINGDEYKLF